MKIFCEFSGVPLLQDSLFPEFKELKLASRHPVFYAKNKVLLSSKMLMPWYQGSLSNEAKSLLFLAIAHNNGLITFEQGVIANPSAKIVESCFFPMLHIVSCFK